MPGTDPEGTETRSEKEIRDRANQNPDPDPKNPTGIPDEPRRK